VARHLYGFVLDMLGRGLLGDGPPDPRPPILWKRLLLGLSNLLAIDPERVCNHLFNAAHQVAGLPSARADGFVDELIRFGGTIDDLDLFFDGGRILAWKAGLTRLRETALGLLATLPARHVTGILGLPGDRPVDSATIGRNLRAWPWLQPALAAADQPDLTIARVARVGGFIGLGGPFAAPPVVFAADGRILAHDRERCLELVADRFGHVFLPCDGVPFPDAHPTDGRGASGVGNTVGGGTAPGAASHALAAAVSILGTASQALAATVSSVGSALQALASRSPSLPSPHAPVAGSRKTTAGSHPLPHPDGEEGPTRLVGTTAAPDASPENDGMTASSPDSGPPIIFFQAGAMTWGKHAAAFPAFSQPSGVAVTEATIAVSLPHSYCIFLFGLTGRTA